MRQNGGMAENNRRVALFDSFGTLVRGSQARPWAERLVAVAAEFGISVDEETARRAAVDALGFMNQHTTIRTPEEEHRMYLGYYRLLLEQLGVRDDLERRAAELNDRYRVRECWLRPFDETPPVLAALKRHGYRLAVVSDGFPSLRQDYRRMGLAGYFDAIVVAGELGAWKPDRRVYEQALALMEADVEDAIYLDDTPSDAAGAASLGIRTWLIDRQDRYQAVALPRVATLGEFASALGVAV